MEEDIEEYRLSATLPKEAWSPWMKLMIADIRQKLERFENILFTQCDSRTRLRLVILGHLVYVRNLGILFSGTTSGLSRRVGCENDAEELATCIEALKDMTKHVHQSCEQSKRVLEERKKERKAVYRLPVKGGND
ncbi:uncharacterized protein LAESUDRAFT_761242 [Laetiporus sulphureus 93-53]|uniref:Uncharacterized protein n=1 Tax=Laetiporus sulphureus 93-53 TaxID=1314785 RepID=A0A165DA53_9APHY|nr:uncharacterized protein LAESUDRAFT_761242 [Laetiporus sulphureus 93-53]KZT04422.1 hypothetical protein LAESUDRAFT_761242 [Laetiporus sulphureus 93-53]